MHQPVPGASGTFPLRLLKIALLIAFFLLQPSAARAQNTTLNGFVTDQSTDESLVGANVSLLSLADDDASPRGAVAGTDGSFVITRLTPGRFQLRVSFVGYRAFVDTLALEAGETRTISIALQSGAALEAVEVRAEQAGAAGVTAGRQRIRPEDIDRVPVPDVSGDLASYLTAQPGIVSTGDRGGQLFIRGGEPSQNVTYLDGLPIRQPFHLLGFYSAFPSDIISTADVYAGGYGAQFGGGLSAVIDVASRNGNKNRWGGAVSGSPFVTSAQVEGPILPGRVSFLGHARRSVLEQGAAQYIDDPLSFMFTDFFGKLNAELSEASRLSVTGMGTYDRGTIGPEARFEAPDEVRYQNQALGLRYLVLPTVLPVRAEATVGFARHHTELGPRNDPSRQSTIRTTRLALDAFFPGERVRAEAGWQMEFVNLNTELNGRYQNLDLTQPPILSQLAAYVAPEFELGYGFRVRTGLRTQFYRLRFNPFVEPRLRVVWEHGMHQVSGAVGLYQQEVIGLSDRRDAANVFTAWTNIPKENRLQEGDARAGRLPWALHGLLGYQVQPLSWLTVSAEGYYKSIDHLFVSEWTAYPRFTTNLQPARGRSFGAEARVEVRRPNWYAYLNYGYSNTRYWAQQASIELWYGEEELDYRPPHDRRHQVNLLANTERWGVDFSMRWAFGSGRPFSRPQGFDEFVLLNGVIDVSKVPSRKRVIYERPYNSVLPTYHRLDVSAGYTFDWEAADVTVQASAINTYDRRNLFYLDVFSLQRIDQLPLVPALGVKIEV